MILQEITQGEEEENRICCQIKLYVTKYILFHISDKWRCAGVQGGRCAVGRAELEYPNVGYKHQSFSSLMVEMRTLWTENIIELRDVVMVIYKNNREQLMPTSLWTANQLTREERKWEWVRESERREVYLKSSSKVANLSWQNVICQKFFIGCILGLISSNVRNDSQLRP